MHFFISDHIYALRFKPFIELNRSSFNLSQSVFIYLRNMYVMYLFSVLCSARLTHTLTCDLVCVSLSDDANS